jgi:hypothetical protein
MSRNPILYRKLAFSVYCNAKICVKCYALKNIEVHHKDENIDNHLEENLQILCKKCHTRLHKKWMIVSDKTRKKIGKSHLWLKRSLEAREKIRLSKIGNKNALWAVRSLETRRKMQLWKKGKKIIQLTMDWEIIKVWDYIIEAKRQLKLSNINNCLNWRHKTCWWYKWKYFINNL